MVIEYSDLVGDLSYEDAGFQSHGDIQQLLVYVMENLIVRIG